MRVVDTSAWIEGFILGRESQSIVRELPPRNQCVVPTIVQYELAKWCDRNLDEDMAGSVMAYTTRCIVVDLETSIAIGAAELARQYELAMADAIVYATMLHAGADLLTCDAHFRDLPSVIYVPKT